MLQQFSDESTFRDALQEYFTPAQPVSRPEHLYGRSQKLRLIDRALNSPGKHIFVYGDRGVGKTSIGRTAAAIHTPDVAKGPFVACDQEATFFDLVDNIYRQIFALRSEGKYTDDTPTNLLRPNAGGASGLALPAMRTINDAVEILKSIAPKSGPPPLVIVDEFDQLGEERDKKYFADLIKQISDQEINLRLIICGIGSSLDQLIGVHLSTDRYVAPVALEPLPHDARWAIMEAASNHFQLPMDRDGLIRVGQISDGFPYYVHLIGEKIFWEAFDDVKPATRITIDHYANGIRAAIEEAQTSLKQAYDIAIQKHKNTEDYEEVLWAVADGPLLRRQVTDIYENSYCSIMDQRRGRPRLAKDAFYQRINRLKQEAHGAIVMGNRQGWYEFRENVVRGYVRMRAERAGVRIGVDHIKAGKS